MEGTLSEIVVLQQYLYPLVRLGFSTLASRGLVILALWYEATHESEFIILSWQFGSEGHVGWPIG